MQRFDEHGNKWYEDESTNAEWLFALGCYLAAIVCVLIVAGAVVYNVFFNN